MVFYVIAVLMIGYVEIPQTLKDRTVFSPVHQPSLIIVSWGNNSIADDHIIAKSDGTVILITHKMATLNQRKVIWSL
jgi:hypothetical protein